MRITKWSFLPVLAGVSIGLAGLVSAPVEAKKKAEAPAIAKRGWAISDAFRKMAEPADGDIKVKSYGAALLKIDALEKAAVQPDEKFLAAAYRYRVGQGQENLKQLYLGSAGMLASGGAAEDQRGELASLAGRYAFLLGNHKATRTYLGEAAKLGKATSDQAIMMSESAFKLNLPQDGLASLKEATRLAGAEGKAVPDSWYERGEVHLAAAKDFAGLAVLGQDYVRAKPTPFNWYARVLNYWQSANGRGVTAAQGGLDAAAGLDLYRLVREAKAIANGADLMGFADHALRNGAPSEARLAIIDAEARSLILSSDKQAATMKTQASAAKFKAVTGTEARKLTADADWQLQSGNLAKALTQYRAALTKPGADADLINTRLGIAHYRSGQKAEARAAFEQVQGSRKGVAGYWLLWLDLNP